MASSSRSRQTTRRQRTRSASAKPSDYRVFTRPDLRAATAALEDARRDPFRSLRAIIEHQRPELADGVELIVWSELGLSARGPTARLEELGVLVDEMTALGPKVRALLPASEWKRMKPIAGDSPHLLGVFVASSGDEHVLTLEDRGRLAASARPHELALAPGEAWARLFSSMSWTPSVHAEADARNPSAMIVRMRGFDGWISLTQVAEALAKLVVRPRALGTKVRMLLPGADASSLKLAQTPSLHFEAAQHALDDGELGAALEAIETALELEGVSTYGLGGEKRGDAHWLHARVLARMGKDEAALMAARRALQVDDGLRGDMVHCPDLAPIAAQIRELDPES